MTRRTALLSAAFAARAPAQVEAIPVIIDTDVGSDDLIAIAFLLARPDIRVEAITVANGLAHVDRGAANLIRLLTLAGELDIPVYAGRPSPMSGDRVFPEEWRSTSDNLPGVPLPSPKRYPER